MTEPQRPYYDGESAQAGALVCWNNGDGPLRYVGPATDASCCGCFLWLGGRHKGTYAAYKASELRMAPTPFRPNGWYWVRKSGWDDTNFGPWIPAEWRQESKSWYSTKFSGIPESEVIVGDPVTPAVIVGRWDSTEPSGIRWNKEFVRGSFEDGALLAVLTNNLSPN